VSGVFDMTEGAIHSSVMSVGFLFRHDGGEQSSPCFFRRDRRGNLLESISICGEGSVCSYFS